MFNYLIIGVILFVVGCSVPQDSPYSQTVGELDIPNQYSVVQSGVNTGFAGVIDTGEYLYEDTFEVIDEVIVGNNITTHTRYTMSAIKELLSTLSVHEQGVKITDTTTCYFQEQWGVMASVVCVDDHHITYFKQTLTKGNHVSQEITWYQKGTDIVQIDSCEESRNMFCPILYRALLYDSQACERIPVSKEYCVQLHEQII